MPCEPVKIGNTVGLVCSRSAPRRKCRFCGSSASLLCDYASRRDPTNTSTCDKPLCPRCAVREGDLDFCPDHPARVPPPQLSLVL